METIPDLVADLRRNRGEYSAIEKRVETEFKKKVRNPTFLWQSRVKSPASLEKKLRDRSNKYENEAANVADVRDLVGARIILARHDDVRDIEEFVRKTFNVVHQTQHPKDKINIVDSGKRFRGYDALHLYVTLHSRSDEQYWNPVVEIQVMTGFMWVYATLHHDVVYKELSGDPTADLLLKIDMIRGAANVKELALEMYDKGFLTPDVNSELKSRVESAVDLDARSQSVLHLTNPRHDRHRAEPSIVPGFEDAAEERAYALIKNETRNKAAHLEGVAEARQILLQGIATFTNDGSSSIRHLRMLRYLAVAERKLSLEEGLDTGKNMELLNQAERHIDMAVGLDMQPGLEGAREQMTLEQHIVRGLRARLEFRMHFRSMGATRRLLSDVSTGIEKALEDLEKVDVVKYEKNTKFGLEWINYFRTFTDWQTGGNSKIWAGDETASGVNSKGHTFARFTQSDSADVHLEEHPDTLTSMNNLASVLGSQGKHEEAEGIHRRTLILRDSVLGKKPENEAAGALLEQQASEFPDKSQNLEDWIAGNAGFVMPALPDQAEDQISEVSSDNNDNRSESESELETINALPHISQMEKSIEGGQAFRNLELDVRIFLLPATLQALTRIIMSIPDDRVWISTGEDLSLGNKLKLLMERITDEEWNWWPFRPAMMVLQSDQVRIHWKCHCNTYFWHEVSKTDAEKIRDLLDSRGAATYNDHLCLRARRQHHQNYWATVIQGIRRVAGFGENHRPRHGAGPSGEAPQQQQGTSAGLSSSQPQPRQGPAAGRYEYSGESINASNTQQQIVSQQEGNPTSINISQAPDLRVIYGVKGSRLTPDLTEINVAPLHGDTVLFRRLREENKRLRGRLRHWCSMWQLNHCDFVKFKKTIGGRVIFVDGSLPVDPMYEYDPRAPHAAYPPISSHEFALALAACSDRCNSISPFHDCIQLLPGNDWIKKIPKWNAQFEWKQQGPEYGWGLQARHSISLVHLVFYHVLIFAGTFGFWIWWEIRHPEDLQNAAVPLTTVVVFLSLFWSAAGILKIFREPT